VLETHSIPFLIPASVRSEEVKEMLEGVDIVLVSSFGSFLPSSVLSIPKYGTFNLHPSLLPKYRGAAPVARAIERGEKGIIIAW